LKTVDKIFAWILIVLGCIHSGATFVAYHHLGFESIWFFAGGVAFIGTGLLNLIRTQTTAGYTHVSSIIMNVLATLICVAIIPVMGRDLIHAPNVIAAMIVVVVELIFSVRK
jgi:hypothetical protein